MAIVRTQTPPADFRKLTQAAQASKASQPAAFGQHSIESQQNPMSVFSNPYRTAGSTPLPVHTARVAAAAANTGVARTVIGPTGPNSQPTARLSKAVIKPRNTLPPRAPGARPVSTQGGKPNNQRVKTGFFANPTAVVRK